MTENASFDSNVFWNALGTGHCECEGHVRNLAKPGRASQNLQTGKVKCVGYGPCTQHTP